LYVVEVEDVMKVHEVMTRHPICCTPDTTLEAAACLMCDCDCGAIPVVGDTLTKLPLGMITDRDIVVRGVAAGLAPDNGCVSDAMSTDILYCTAEQDTAQVLKTMGEHQVRRLPVVDATNKTLIGIVSLGDLALEQPHAVGPTVSEISEKDGSVRT
jgi:CBS domain-containing protein